MGGGSYVLSHICGKEVEKFMVYDILDRVYYTNHIMILSGCML